METQKVFDGHEINVLEDIETVGEFIPPETTPPTDRECPLSFEELNSYVKTNTN